MVEQVRPVNERVQALIGLDSDAFLRTVILPQGRFARLLVEDKPSDRTEILRQVWGTGDLEAAGEVARRRLDEVRTLAVRLRDEVARHPDDPEAELARLTDEAGAASRRAVETADLRDRSTRARDVLRQSEATIAAAGRTEQRVTPSAMDETDGRLVPVESAQRRMQAEATELEGREVALQRELNGIPTDDGPDHHEVARTLAVLDAIPEQVAQAVGTAVALRGVIATEAEAKKHHVQAQQTLESATDRLTQHRAQEPPLVVAVGSAGDALKEAERWYEKCHDLQKRISTTADALAGREKAMAEVTARLTAARRDLEGAQERLRRTEQSLSEARRANAAAAAAHGLCPGDECPVCEGELPAGWTPPRDTGLDAAGRAQREAGSQADEAGGAVAEFEAQQESGRQRIRDDRGDLDGLRSRIAGALDQLRRGAGLGDAPGILRDAAGPDDALPLAADTPLPDREAILSRAVQRLREAEAELGRHRAEAEVLGETQTSARVDEQSARQTLDHARNDIGRTRKAAGEGLDALNRNIQSISQPFPPPARPGLGSRRAGGGRHHTRRPRLLRGPGARGDPPAARSEAEPPADGNRGDEDSPEGSWRDSQSPGRRASTGPGAGAGRPPDRS